MQITSACRLDPLTRDMMLKKQESRIVVRKVPLHAIRAEFGTDTGLLVDCDYGTVWFYDADPACARVCESL